MSKPLKVAYIMSRFPTMTETFILYEMLAMEKMGVQVEIFPLLESRDRITHPESEPLRKRARFHPFLSPKILRANWHYIRRQPRRYFRLLFDVMRHTWGSANYFIGAVGIFPKSVRFAYEMEFAAVDHVHAHFVNHPAVAGFIITRLTGIPFSFTAHGSDLHVERRMLPQKVEAASFAVTISEYNKELILSECGRHVSGKIHMIHCGVDPAMFSPVTFKISGKPVRIVSVGSLIEVKGHKYLIDACNLLCRRGIDFVCDLIGEGNLRRQLERQVVRLGLQDRIRFHGWKARPELADMLKEADVAVLTSVQTRNGKREGIPVVLMEAMATALPVVASRISGIPELVQHGRTGFLTAPHDAIAIADALERLGRDRELRLRMGTEGRRRVLQEFNLESNAEKLLGLFQSEFAEEVRYSA